MEFSSFRAGKMMRISILFKESCFKSRNDDACSITYPLFMEIPCGIKVFRFQIVETLTYLE